MNKDQFEGLKKEIAGKVKEVAGRILGDNAMTVTGKAKHTHSSRIGLSSTQAAVAHAGTGFKSQGNPGFPARVEGSP
jgi:hypothetical protein